MNWLLAAVCFLGAYLLGKEKTDESLSAVHDDATDSSGSGAASKQHSVRQTTNGTGRVKQARDVTPKRRADDAVLQSTDDVATGSVVSDNRSRQSDADAAKAGQTFGVRQNKAGRWIWADGPDKGRLIPKTDPAYPVEEHADGETETADAATG